MFIGSCYTMVMDMATLRVFWNISSTMLSVSFESHYLVHYANVSDVE